MTTSPTETTLRPDALETAHFQQLQCSRQWRDFLAAMGAEFASALPVQDLATLMARIGLRFAAEHPLAACDTVAGLQQEMNRVWESLEWGWAELGQSGEGMEVTHRLSPLTSAFGEAQMPWACGFLQGVYQHWFTTAGAQGLQVDVMAVPDALGSLRLRLAPA